MRLGAFGEAEPVVGWFGDFGTIGIYGDFGGNGVGMERREPVEGVDGESGETLAPGFDALDGDEVGNFDDFGCDLLAALRAVYDLEPRIAIEGEREKKGAVVVKEGGLPVGGIRQEALEVGVAVGGAVEDGDERVEGRADKGTGVELAELEEVVVEVVGEVERSGAVAGALHERQDTVVGLEFAQEGPSLIDIEAFDALVEPYLAC